MRWLLSLALFGVLAAPAKAVDPAIEDGSAQTELNTARERWAAANLTDYRFRQSIGCFCPRTVTKPRTMRVRDGKAVEPGRFHRRYATVPKLFTVIQDAIDDEVDKLTATYGTRGLPRKIFVDTSELTADEELWLSASRLHSLP